MAFKVIIDAGHGGRDPGAVYDGRQEKDDTLRLAFDVGGILKANGVDVEYTRVSDVYDTPYEKAVKGNNSGADLFLSIHRNAAEIPGTGSGIETLVYDKSGDKLKYAVNINKQLERLGFTNRGVTARPNLVVLKRTKMPAVLVEVGFIDSEADNSLLDLKFTEVAQAIADGILETIDQPVFAKISEVPEKSNTIYRVQVGAFRKLDNAIMLEQRLRAAGYDTIIVAEE